MSALDSLSAAASSNMVAGTSAAENSVSDSVTAAPAAGGVPGGAASTSEIESLDAVVPLQVNRN